MAAVERAYELVCQQADWGIRLRNKAMSPAPRLYVLEMLLHLDHWANVS